MYQKALVFFGLVGVSLSLLLGFSSIISWQIVAVLIAVSLGIPSLVLTYEKPTVEASVKPEREKREIKRTLTNETVTLRNETIHVSPADNGYYYMFELTRGDYLKGEIISTNPIDIYFVDSINFKKWDKNRSFDIENCNESVLKTKISYYVPKKGTWYLIIENNGRKSATVKVHLF